MEVQWELWPMRFCNRAGCAFKVAPVLNLNIDLALESKLTYMTHGFVFFFPICFIAWMRSSSVCGSPAAFIPAQWKDKRQQAQIEIQEIPFQWKRKNVITVHVNERWNRLLRGRVVFTLGDGTALSCVGSEQPPWVGPAGVVLLDIQPGVPQLLNSAVLWSEFFLYRLDAHSNVELQNGMFCLEM